MIKLSKEVVYNLKRMIVKNAIGVALNRTFIDKGPAANYSWRPSTPENDRLYRDEIERDMEREGQRRLYADKQPKGLLSDFINKNFDLSPNNVVWKDISNIANSLQRDPTFLSRLFNSASKSDAEIGNLWRNFSKPYTGK